jgi:hypothetical protein
MPVERVEISDKDFVDLVRQSDRQFMLSGVSTAAPAIYGRPLSKKFIAPRSVHADPDAAARKLVEIANAVEAVQDVRIYIERALHDGAAAITICFRFHDVARAKLLVG